MSTVIFNNDEQWVSVSFWCEPVVTDNNLSRWDIMALPPFYNDLLWALYLRVVCKMCLISLRDKDVTWHTNSPCLLSALYTKPWFTMQWFTFEALHQWCKATVEFVNDVSVQKNILQYSSASESHWLWTHFVSPDVLVSTFDLLNPLCVSSGTGSSHLANGVSK